MPPAVKGWRAASPPFPSVSAARLPLATLARMGSFAKLLGAVGSLLFFGGLLLGLLVVVYVVSKPVFVILLAIVAVCAIAAVSARRRRHA